MELKSYRDSIMSMNTLADIKAEIPLESEILIPDYLPAVFKIVKTLVHRVVLQKQLQNGHLLIEGYFRLEVFYQSEEQKLCTVEQKLAGSIAANGARPVENGMKHQGATVVKSDVTQLTKKDRAEVNRRALNGEKISFG